MAEVDRVDSGTAIGRNELRQDEGFSIVNEFGSVFVRKIYTRNGERLQITAARLGYETRLDALQLEAISWQQPEFFSQLMATPFGPEAEHS